MKSETTFEFDMRTLKPEHAGELEESILESLRREEINIVRKKAVLLGLCAGSVIGAAFTAAIVLICVLLIPETQALPVQEVREKETETEIVPFAKAPLAPQRRGEHLENGFELFSGEASLPRFGFHSERKEPLHGRALSDSPPESYAKRLRQNEILLKEMFQM